MQYDFESETIPIKFRQLLVPAPGINNKAKELWKFNSFFDKVYR